MKITEIPNSQNTQNYRKPKTTKKTQKRVLQEFIPGQSKEDILKDFKRK